MVLKYFKFKIGKIIADMWFNNTLDYQKTYRFIIFCYGLPSHPYQHSPAKVEKLIDAGFILLYPHYIGTWASYGKMSWDNCIKTVLETIKFVKGEKGKDILTSHELNWKVKDITLIGGSFGGSVVLVSGAKSKDINNIISVAAPTDFRTHARVPAETEESVENLFYVVKNGWGNLWRIPNKKEWDKLTQGNVDLNAIDYVDELKNKNVFLIHGAKDNVVSVKRSIELYSQIKTGKGKYKLQILKNESHKGNDVVGREDVFQKVIEFLRL